MIDIKPFTYDRKKIDAFILELKALKLKAVELKLGHTGKVLDEAEKNAGWEYAEILERIGGK